MLSGHLGRYAEDEPGVNGQDYMSGSRCLLTIIPDVDWVIGVRRGALYPGTRYKVAVVADMYKPDET